MDISPDSRLVVLGLADGTYRLVELATGRELARLEDPEQLAASASFTSDGTRLVVSAAYGLRVWELRRIRKELVKLGLDWDVPPYPAPKEEKDREPLHITVDLGEPAPQTASAGRRQARPGTTSTSGRPREPGDRLDAG